MGGPLFLIFGIKGKPRHARAEGRWAPVAPVHRTTEGEAETKSFCPCQKTDERFFSRLFFLHINAYCGEYYEF